MTTPPMETAAGNVDAAAAWDGPEGDHWTHHADRYEAAGAAFTRVLLDAVSLEGHNAILDVGCGTGALTLELGRRLPTGSALGIDLSSRMVEHAAAAADAEKLHHVRFEHADAQIHPFPPETFDTVVSSFGAMFFADPVAAFENLRHAMQPGGSMIVLAWRDLDRNEWITEFRAALAAGRVLPVPPPGAPSPFAMADRDITTERLHAAGFEGVSFTSVDQPMNFGQDADDAWPFVSTMGMARGLTADLDGDDRQAALTSLRATLDAHETPDGVCYPGSAWLVTARNGGGQS